MSEQDKWTDQFKLRPEDIPEYAMKIMGMALFEMTMRFLSQPGGREMLDEETARRKLRQQKEREHDAPK